MPELATSQGRIASPQPNKIRAWFMSNELIG
jgi:hypothetical protein